MNCKYKKFESIETSPGGMMLVMWVSCSNPDSGYERFNEITNSDGRKLTPCKDCTLRD